MKLPLEFNHVSFLFVYTMEAHAEDEWPISSARYDPSEKPVRIKQHTNNEDRLAAARNFQKVFDVTSMPIFVDVIENEFEEIFRTWYATFI